MCHTPGGFAGDIANPTSGLHNLTLAGTIAHDDAFDDGTPPPTYGCTSCHQSSPTDSHINGTANNPSTATFSWDQATYTWTLNNGNDADNTNDTCTASCHLDQGDWTRLWSTDAEADHTVTTPGQTYCSVCHGEVGDFRAGVEHVTVSPNTATSVPHDCDTCHFITSSAQHRDGNLDLNNNGAAGCTSYTPSTGNTGSFFGLYCSGCHNNDDNHTSPETDGNYWTRDMRQVNGVLHRGRPPVGRLHQLPQQRPGQPPGHRGRDRRSGDLQRRRGLRPRLAPHRRLSC